MSVVPLFPQHPPHPSFDIVQDSPKGALALFRPTAATLRHKQATEKEFRWRSRDQRKGRHEPTRPASDASRIKLSFGGRLSRMLVPEYWNVSWWVAMWFTLGSVVWVINGFFVFLPFWNPNTSTNSDAIGWTAWVGATLFEFGSLLLIWEAWNRGETAYFGWGLEEALRGNYRTRVQNGITSIVQDGAGDPEKNSSPSQPSSQARRWIWFTTDTRYWRELGFVAGVIQLCAASIFWISGWTGLPAIMQSIEQKTGLVDGIFWTPQVVGGTGFIISSTLYMLECQKKWYLPAPTNLGWHVGFWNLIGAVGFTLCGALGYSMAHQAQYESSLSTFWGGWAFLIGSCLQWYEAVNPVTQNVL